MENDLISIIVPVYNVEMYLERCIDSVLNQTYHNIELILVDDGSSDSCGKICDFYAEKDSRVKVIHKENGGQASARNMALDIMIGDYVGFVDSDDYILPDMYESLYTILKKHSAEMAICSVINDHLFVKKAFKYFDREQVYDKLGLMKAYLTTPYIGCGICNKLYKSELWKDIRFPVYKAREDIAVLHHVYGRCNSAVHIGECKYVQYIRPGSTEQKGFSKDLLVTVDIYRERAKYIEKNFPELAKYVELSLPQAYKSLMDNMLVGGNYEANMFNNLFGEFCFELEKCREHNLENFEKYTKLQWITKHKKAYMGKCKALRFKTVMLNYRKAIGIKTEK